MKVLRNSFNTSVTFRSELSSGSCRCSPEKAPAAALNGRKKPEQVACSGGEMDGSAVP